MADDTNDTNEQRDDEEGGKRTLFKAFCKWLNSDEGKRAAKGLDLAEDEDDERDDEQEDDDDANGIEGVELSDLDTMLAEVFADAEEGGDFDPRENADEDEEADDDPKREAARAAGVARSPTVRRARSAKGTGAGLALAVKAIGKGARSARKGR